MTVAGTSQYLEPEGADLLGLNVPLGEFQSGMFDTTYVDEELRISRGKVGLVDVLRVFVRKGIDAEVGALVDEDAIAGSASDDNGAVDESEEPNKLEEVRSAVEGVADAVRKVNEDVVETIKGDMDDIVDAVEGVADAVIGKENREMIEKEIEGEIKNVQETAEDVQDAIKEVQSEVEKQLGVNQDEEDEEEGEEEEEEEEESENGDEEESTCRSKEDTDDSA